MNRRQRNEDARHLGLSRRRTAGPPSDTNRIAGLASSSGVPVDEVLREVADFRLALETDMLIAAAALDSDAPTVASDVVGGELVELERFHDRVLDRLADAAMADATRAITTRVEALPRRPRPARFAGVSRLVASAAAIVGLLTAGAVARNAVTGTPRTTEATNAQAQEDLGRLAQASVGHKTDQAKIEAAAQELHDTIETLIAQNPNSIEAEQIVALLRTEVELIRSKPELRQVLARALSLARQLQRKVPGVRPSVAPLLQAAQASPSASPKSKSPSPKPTSSPSPTPSAKSSSSPPPSESRSPDVLRTPEV